MSENPTTAPKRDVIDFGDLWRTCVKRWYVIVASIVFCLLVAFVYNRRTPSEYMVRSNMLIVQDEMSGLAAAAGGAGAGLGALLGNSAEVNDELYSVQSHSLLTEVARKLGLENTYWVRDGFLKAHMAWNDSPIAMQAAPGIADTITASLLFKVKVSKDGRANIKGKWQFHTIGELEDVTLPATLKTEFGDFTFTKTADFPAGESVAVGIGFCGYDEAAEILAEDIEIDLASRKANVIYLQMEAANVPRAKAILNAIVTEYNSRGLDEKRQRTQRTLDFLDSRLALLAGDLAESERTIQDFKTKNNIPDVEAEAEYQYTKRGSVEVELIKAETEARVASMLRDYLSDPANASSPVPAALLGEGGSAAAADLAEYNKRIVLRDRLASTVSPGNQALVQLDRELEMRRSGLLTSITKSLDGANLKVAELRGKANATAGRLGSVPAQERIYRDIERERTIRETLYIFLLQHREERAIMLANGQEKGQVLDPAYAGVKELGLSDKMVYLFAFILGAVMGVALLYVMRVMRTRFASKEEFERLSGAPILGEVCTDRSGRSLVVRTGGSNSAAELFRLIRSNLQFILGEDGDKVILMTSTRTGEGKSYISINLAASLSLLERRVLLIGADVRNPKLAEYLDLPHHTGLTEYLSSDRYQISDVIRRNPLGNGVDIITAGPVPPNPSELLSGKKLREMVAQLRGMYDYIVIDSAPVGMVSDTFAMGELADATVYVTRANYTTRTDVNFLNEVYTTRRLPRLAVVVNGTASKKGYGYGYGKTEE